MLSAMFNFNEMEASMGFAGSAALHPTDSAGVAMAAPNYSASSNFAQRYHQHAHHQQLPTPNQMLSASGIDAKVTNIGGDYGDSSLAKATHMAYHLGSENVKRFSVNNLLNLVGYNELSRNHGKFGTMDYSLHKNVL